MTSGDERVEFDTFVATYSRRLLHTAELLVGPADAQDLVQDVLMRMYTRWHKIEQQDPVGYARRSLANAARDRWRRRRITEILVAAFPDRPKASSGAETHAERDSVLRALSGLTARERTVVVLRFYEDLSEAQVAKDLGVALGTVKSTASRALAKLRLSEHLSTPIGTDAEGARP